MPIFGVARLVVPGNELADADGDVYWCLRIRYDDAGIQAADEA